MTIDTDTLLHRIDVISWAICNLLTAWSTWSNLLVLLFFLISKPPLMKLGLFRVLGIWIILTILKAPKSVTQAEIGVKQTSPVVKTKSGAVAGKIENLPLGRSVHEYLGIPYAQPPVGELRFAPPKPAEPWSGTKDATEYGPWCPQPLSLSLVNPHALSGTCFIREQSTGFNSNPRP